VLLGERAAIRRKEQISTYIEENSSLYASCVVVLIQRHVVWLVTVDIHTKHLESEDTGVHIENAVSHHAR
jgi:hypothetical protein